MRQVLLILLPSLAAISASGCVVGGATGAPYAENQRHTYTGFDRVDVAAGVEAIVTQGNFDVKAEARSGADFKNLIVEVRGSTLHIARRSTMFGWGSGEHYRVTVSAPKYTALEASSGASLDGSGLQLGDLKVEASSGAHVELAGSCVSLRIGVSSGAHFDGQDLKCEMAEVDASSGAHADAFATRSAEGNASSGANVTFYGKPASVLKDTSSGGSVDAR